jgi:DNA repair protein RadC
MTHIGVRDTTNDGHRNRLRKRFQKSGFESFAPHEIVELMLTLAIPRKDVKKPAKLLLKKFGSLKSILDASVTELESIEGIGKVTPVAIKIIKDLATVYIQLQSQEHEYLGNPQHLIKFWQMRIGSSSIERFEVAYLDSKLKLLTDGVETIEEGTTDRANVYPRKVIESALKRKASALVFAHNHPNGNVEPTEEDKILTRSLVLAAATIQIQVIDHIIVAEQNTFSFRNAGML